MEEMITIKELYETCCACPVQYEGRLDNGCFIYIRERWDNLTIEIGNDVDFKSAVCGEMFFFKRCDIHAETLQKRYDKLRKEVGRDKIIFPRKIRQAHIDVFENKELLNKS